MRVTIHQPVPFPYAGIVSKILNADKFMFLDDVQFDKSGFQNRNRILSKEGQQWFTIPVCKPRYGRKINEIRIQNQLRWKETILNALQHNYGKAKYFQPVFQLVKDVLDNDYEFIVDFNKASMCAVLSFFRIERPIYSSSEIPDKPQGKTERIIYLTKYMGGDEFLSGDGAKAYIEEEQFTDITLVYQNYPCKPYPQMWTETFVPYMSILDYMMNIGADTSFL